MSESDDPLFLDATFHLTRRGIVAHLEGLQYLLASMDHTTVTFTAPNATATRTVTPDSEPVIEYFEDVRTVSVDDGRFGRFWFWSDVERLQMQVHQNPVVDVFELDFDHTFKDLGQRVVRTVLVPSTMELLGDRLGGARVLELYAGTGAVALEALSRGARAADFVENNPAALHSLKANVAKLRVTDRTRIFKNDALRWVHRLEPDRYDLTFADPPYGSRQADRLVEDWLTLRYSPVLTLEHAADHELPAGDDVRRRSRKMGDSRITVYEMR